MSARLNVSEYILFEDEYVLLINKPPGLMVEPDRNNHRNLLQEVRTYLKDNSGEPEIYAQHIHRLDRPVSGVILFAKQRNVLKNLSEQFAERRVKKFYSALTQKAPDQKQGTLDHWHRKEKKKAVLASEEFQYAEKASLSYSVQPSGNCFLWEIELHTGKYHQIRAQLASIGCTIIGDELYGSTRAYQSNAIALHAHRLIFHHPVTNEEMIVEKAPDFKV